MCLHKFLEDVAWERSGDGADVLLEFGDVLVAEGIAVDAGFGEAELEGDVIGVGPATAGSRLGDGCAGEDAPDDGEAVEDADAESGRVFEEAT